MGTMRRPAFPALLGAAALAAPFTPAIAAEAVRAELKGHAVLPAGTMVPPPVDAPRTLVVSGRFAGGGGKRIEAPGSVEGTSPQAPDVAPRGTGTFLPFVGQAVQGFSGIGSLGDGEFLVLTDNGFGSKANSPDAMLMLHRLRPDWASGRVRLAETVFLRDPDKVIPFELNLESTAERYLTGADLDPESVQPVGELVWIGDEFGPSLVAVDRSGKVVHFSETRIDGETVRSPDHHAVRVPAAPEPVTFEVRRSRGFEGMAASPDGRFLYPMLEGPLYLGGDAASPEKVDGREVARILEFHVAARGFTGRHWKYPLEADGHGIGDFNLVDGSRGLVIERDNKEGDPRLRCRGEPEPGCFHDPAAFKRVYLVDLGRADARGMLEKIAYVDLLDIKDLGGVARAGTADGVFAFPFVTIESVDAVDGRTIVVANDNNFPFSNGRKPLAADDNELILLDVGDLMGR
jgi:hypothetical protein